MPTRTSLLHIRSRSKWTALLAAAWFLSSILVVATAKEPGAKKFRRRPNVILFILDQWRYDALGAYGNNRLIRTPNMDSIAADGVLFDNAYSSTPTCTPARAAILTGRSPWGHGMLGYGSMSERYPLELVRTLNRIGYRTEVVGKNHFGWYNATAPVLHGYSYHKIYDGGGNGFPNTTSFGYDDYDEWFQGKFPDGDPLATGRPLMGWNSWRAAPYVYDETYHPTAWTTREALSSLDRYFRETETTSRLRQKRNRHKAKQKKPLFMKISYHRPHSPYDPPARFLNRTLDVGIPPYPVSDTWDLKYKAASKHCGPSNPNAWCGSMPSNQTATTRAAYYANIEFIDEGIGQILKSLKEKGLYDDTLILLTADHGDMQGEHYLWRKSYPYEGSAHVPMVLKWPASMDVTVNRGDRLHEVVELRDILPTIVNAAGYDDIPGDVTIEGMSMLCLLSDGCSQRWRDYLDLEHSTCYNVTNHWNALTDGRYKYIFHAYDATEQLFDLIHDPHELVDLAPRATYDTTLNATLSTWRRRMVKQFEREGRGPAWVKDGTLKKRTEGKTYGPNFPGDAAPRWQSIAGQLA